MTRAVTMSAWVAREVTMFARVARAVTMFAELALRHNAKNGYVTQYGSRPQGLWTLHFGVDKFDSCQMKARKLTLYNCQSAIT